MTAKDARDLAKKDELNGIEEIYNAIRERIQHDKYDKYSLYWHGYLSDAIKEKLEQDGFNVEYGNDFRDGSSWFRISW